MYGSISGATLGYILGGTRGAKAGYKVGKLAQNSRNMAPIRKRKSTSTVMARTKRRDSTTSTKGNQRESKYIPHDSSRITVKRKRKSKPKKSVKVSTNLRKKIKKVLEHAKIPGYLQETAYQKLSFDNTTTQRQVVQYDNTTGTLVDAFFSPGRILDAASVLWNNKTILQAPKLIADTGNFDNKGIKVYIKNAYTKQEFRNNTQRIMTLQIVEFSAKSNQVAGDPLGVWQAALLFQTAAQGANQNGYVKEALHAMPTILPDFNRLFSTRVTKIVLQPGGQYNHFIQGPKDVLYDYQKMWNGNTFQNNNKNAVYCSYIYYPDVINTTTNGVGRVGGTPAGTEFLGITVETTHCYHMAMPEQTGFVVAATAGQTESLKQRQFSHLVQVWANATGEGIRVDDQAPNDIEVDPLS